MLSPSAGFFVSNDHGESFYERSNSLTKTSSACSVSAMGAFPGKLFIGTEVVDDYDYRLWVSEDAGISFNEVKLPEDFNHRYQAMSTYGHSIAIATTFDVYISYDEGRTFDREFSRNINKFLRKEQLKVASLLLRGPDLFIGTDYGLLVYHDSGKTFTRITQDQGLTGHLAYSIAIVNDDLLVGTETGLSIFRGQARKAE